MNEIEVCPQCACSVKNSNSRLIQDACGHKKCRLCLLKEEDGCAACIAEEISHNVRAGELDSSLNFNITQSTDHSLTKPRQASSESNIKPTNDVDIGLQTDNEENCASPEKNDSSNKQIKKRKPFFIESHIIILPGKPVQYRCTKCNKTCSSRMTVRYHNYCASKTKPFTCKICNKGFVTKDHYEYHLRTHSGTSPFVCSVCNKAFKQRGKLTRHMKMHSGDRPLICQECGKTFATTESLKSHQRTHSGEKPHICNLCSKAFSEYSNYKKHLLLHKGEKTYMCDECGKTFTFKWGLRAHQLIHSRERNYACSVCNRKFAMKKDLKRHLIVHSAVRPHNCSLCDTGFRRKDNLERHMKNTHPETRMVSVTGNQAKLPVQLSKSSKCSDQNSISENEIGEARIHGTSSSKGTSTIPPSQTINASMLRSVPLLSNSDTNCKQTNTKRQLSSDSLESPLKQAYEIPGTENQCTRQIHNTQNSVLKNNLSHRDENPLILRDISDTSDLQKTCIEDHSSRQQNTLQMKTNCVYPPKKNTESYRVVSVINRPSNTNSSNHFAENLLNKSISSENAERFEAKNCVPTIRRASESNIGTVITRNLQQNVQTIVKPTSKLECYRTLEPLQNKEHVNSDQILRTMLRDVDCSNANAIDLASMNCADKQTICHMTAKHFDNNKFEKMHQLGPKLHSDNISEVCELHTPMENMSHSCNPYSHLDNSKKQIPDMYFTNNFRSNISQSLTCEEWIMPSYESEMSKSNERKCTDLLQMSEFSNHKMFSKCCSANYETCNTRGTDSSGKLKLLADIAGSETIPICGSAIEQPVIVGTKKSNNIIYSNLHL